jgi:hypothetical protein
MSRMAEPSSPNAAPDQASRAAKPVIPEDGQGGLPDGDTPAAVEPGVPAGASEKPIVNVWSHGTRKYRIRAVVLLLLNLVLFGGLCIFTHWLHVARPFDFSWSSYVEPLKFWGEQTQTLNDFVVYPVSVEQNLMHGVVLGLLVASIVAVPISVAILYGFAYALPFIAAVFTFAHMPWMALTLVGSCVLAAVKPFRLSFRFGAALVGMLPVIVYLYLATQGAPQQIGTYSSPDQRLLVSAPWFLAILAACVMLGITMAISRIVNYRPGAVAPVMAIMFATPAILFYRYVGFDEVSYRVLESLYGPRAPILAARDVTDDILRMLKESLESDDRERMLGSFLADVDTRSALLQPVVRRLQRSFLADRRQAYEACRRFIADHPKSRYVPCALYIQAHALDTRLDIRKLLSPEVSPRREPYSDFPHIQAEEVWQALLTNYPDSPLAAAARLRLAQLRLRRGDVPSTSKLLEPVAKNAPQTQTSTRPNGVLMWAGRPESSLQFDPQPYMQESRHLYELIAANRDDPRYGNEPLKRLAGLDPRRADYRRELLSLAAKFPGALLEDNLLLEWAAATPDRAEREANLAACIAAFPKGDAAAQAELDLARLRVTQPRAETSPAPVGP